MKTINVNEKTIKLSLLNTIIDDDRNILEKELERKKSLYKEKNHYQLSLFGISMSLTRFFGKLSLRILFVILCIITGGGTLNDIFKKNPRKEEKEDLLGNKVDDNNIFRDENTLKENMFLEMPASFKAIKQFKKEKGEDALNSILYVNDGKITYGTLKNYSHEWLKSYKQEEVKLKNLEKIS